MNGVSQATPKKGYLCLESEGAEIPYIGKIKIMKLPAGVTRVDQAAPKAK